MSGFKSITLLIPKQDFLMIYVVYRFYKNNERKGINISTNCIKHSTNRDWRFFYAGMMPRSPRAQICAQNHGRSIRTARINILDFSDKFWCCSFVCFPLKKKLKIKIKININIKIKSTVC